MKEVQEDTRAALDIAAERMKRHYDQHVRESPTLKPGDKVWIDAKNLAMTQPSRKLSYKRLGPYEIVCQIGPLDYEVRIPRAWRIHPVFHVDLLRPHPVDKIPGRAPSNPPPVEVDGQEEFEVEEVVDSRKGRGGKIFYKVKWKGYGPHEMTWEPTENVTNAEKAVKEFHKKYPTKPQSAKFRKIEIPIAIFPKELFRPIPKAITEGISTSLPTENMARKYIRDGTRILRRG